MDVTHFRNGEEEAFQIESRREMRAILQDISRHGTRVFLYHGDECDFIITTLLCADEDGIWLETGPYPEENELILHSRKITFVSAHRQVKIQFAVNGVSDAVHGEHAAFYVALPERLFRIQRREFFRCDIPAHEEARCLIPAIQDDPDAAPALHSVGMLDVSSGGIRLLCGADHAWLKPRTVLPRCVIALPDSDPLTVTLEVRNSAELTTHDNVRHRRVGCRFVDLDNYSEFLLQRHITRLQQESLARLRA